jgi:hypothetical protein
MASGGLGQISEQKNDTGFLISSKQLQFMPAIAEMSMPKDAA